MENNKNFFQNTLAFFISKNSIQFFSQFGINKDFFNDDSSTRNTQIYYLHKKEIVCLLNVIDDTAKRAVKLMEV